MLTDKLATDPLWVRVSDVTFHACLDQAVTGAPDELRLPRPGYEQRGRRARYGYRIDRGRAAALFDYLLSTGRTLVHDPDEATREQGRRVLADAEKLRLKLAR